MEPVVKWKKTNNKLIGNIIATILMFILLIIKPNIVSSINEMIIFISIFLFVFLTIFYSQRFEEKDENINFQIQDFFSLLLWTCFAFQLFFSFGYFRANVDGGSMLPTLVHSQNVIVRSTSNVERGDVVVVVVDKDINELAYGIKDEELLVKRVIGVSGDSIYCINNTIYLNGEIIEEDFLYEGMITSNFTLDSVISNNINIKENSKITIPEDYYLILGDNRSSSNDSRYLGLFHKSQILGIVKYKMLNSIFDWEKVE